MKKWKSKNILYTKTTLHWVNMESCSVCCMWPELWWAGLICNIPTNGSLLSVQESSQKTYCPLIWPGSCETYCGKQRSVERWTDIITIFVSLGFQQLKCVFNSTEVHEWANCYTTEHLEYVKNEMFLLLHSWCFYYSIYSACLHAAYLCAQKHRQQWHTIFLWGPCVKYETGPNHKLWCLT